MLWNSHWFSFFKFFHNQFKLNTWLPGTLLLGAGRWALSGFVVCLFVFFKAQYISMQRWCLVDYFNVGVIFLEDTVIITVELQNLFFVFSLKLFLDQQVRKYKTVTSIRFLWTKMRKLESQQFSSYWSGHSSTATWSLQRLVTAVALLEVIIPKYLSIQQREKSRIWCKNMQVSWKWEYCVSDPGCLHSKNILRFT